jgi:hypothetical protein
VSVEELQVALNHNNFPYFEAVACTGVGVFETLKMIAKLVLNELNRRAK